MVNNPNPPSATLIRSLVTRSSRMAVVVAGLSLAGCAATAPQPAATLTHGVASGEVTDHSAVVWARLDRPGVLAVRLAPTSGGTALVGIAPAGAGHDNTAAIRFDGLRPDTEYAYQADGGDSQAVAGRLRTAPLPDAPRPVRFAWGGDVAGQNVCRDSREGFPIFDVLNRTRWDFFIALGDMIYADNECRAEGAFGNAQVAGGFGPAVDLPGFWAHWRYAREDRAFRAFLAETPSLPVWDDHEVMDDFGPSEDTRAAPPYTPGQHLLPVGLRAFLDYNPLDPATDAGRLYRKLRWGRHVELFLLDTRQYRDANAAADSARQPKSLLGREQLAWLKSALRQSDATWKFIVTSVPLTVPTGWPPDKGRDGWADNGGATGFERELLDLLRFMGDADIRNGVWLTTDVHFAAGHRLRPFADAPGLLMHEFISGPMSAGLFPNRALDPTLNPERLFFFGPDDAKQVRDWREAKRWLNFGDIQVGADGVLRIAITNALGVTVWRSEPLRPR